MWTLLLLTLWIYWHILAHIPAHKHTHTHTCNHTYTHIHTYSHTYIHIGTQNQNLLEFSLEKLLKCFLEPWELILDTDSSFDLSPLLRMTFLHWYQPSVTKSWNLSPISLKMTKNALECSPEPRKLILDTDSSFDSSPRPKMTFLHPYQPPVTKSWNFSQILLELILDVYISTRTHSRPFYNSRSCCISRSRYPNIY